MSYKTYIQNRITRIQSLSRTDPEAAFSEETELVWTIVHKLADGSIPQHQAQETCISLLASRAIQFPRHTS
jgi:hypothetical protein